MKKGLALSLTLGLLLALLAGCEYFVPDSILEEAEKNRPSFLPRGSDPPGSEEPAENVAGGVDEYGFTVFPAGNYLADNKFDTDEYLPDYDADPSFYHGYSTSSYGFCSTEDTIYSFSSQAGDMFHNMLSYTDKATGITGYLCGKPECLHRDESCNAYLTTYLSPGYGLCVYEGKLYWVNGMNDIARMNLDGTGRENVCRVWNKVIENHTNYRMTMFHRGYVYYARVGQTVMGGKEVSVVSVKAQPLDGGEGFVVWEKTVDDYGQRCLIKFVGNDLYIMPTYFNYEDRENHTGAYNIMELYRWDSKTRQGELLCRDVETDMGFEGRSFMPVPGDGIYFHTTSKALYEDEFIVCSVYKYSFASGQMEKVMSFNDEEDHVLRTGFSTPDFTRDYFVVSHIVRPDNDTYEQTLYLYDYDGNLITTRYYGVYGASEFMGADDEYIYYFSMRTEWGEPEENGDRVLRMLGDFIVVPLGDGEIIVIPSYDKTMIAHRG